MAAQPPAGKTAEVKLFEPGPLNPTTLGLLGLVLGMNLAVPYLFAHQFVFPATAFTLGVTAALAIFLRTIAHRTLKTAIYMALGFAVFWSAGAPFAAALQPPADPGAATFWPQALLSTTDAPSAYAAAASLGLASAVALVIVLNEGASRVWTFGLSGFSAALFALATGQVPGGTRTAIVLVLLAVFWTLLSYLMTKGVAGGKATKYKTGEKVRAVVRAALLSLPAFLLLLFAFRLSAAMATTDATIGFAASDVARSFARAPLATGLYFGTAAGLFVLFQILAVAVAALLYDGVLHALGVERQLLKSGETRFLRRVEAKPAAAPAPAKPADPYAELKAGVRKFEKEFEQTDRLTAAQLLNRYKSEFEILAEKHPGGSKEEVQKMLKDLETAFEKKYA
jgi:hypothetical protein